jgi:hypothetical protein
LPPQNTSIKSYEYSSIDRFGVKRAIDEKLGKARKSHFELHKSIAQSERIAKGVREVKRVAAKGKTITAEWDEGRKAGRGYLLQSEEPHPGG